MKSPTCAIVLLLLISFAALPMPAAAERQPGYFEKSSGAEETRPLKEGYFFYTDPKDAPEEDSKKKAPQPVAEQQKPAPEDVYRGRVPWAQVKTMHPNEFQKLMDDQLKYAVQDPSEQERVDNYVALQMVAIQRAEQFQQAWQRTLNTYPALDPTVQRPPTRVASQVAMQSRADDLAGAIDRMRQNMGILVFTRPGCPYCSEQNNIFKIFSGKWNWEHVQEVDITLYPSLAAEYGVELVPDIYLVANLDGEVHKRRLRAGLTTVNEIETGLMEAYSLWFKGRGYMPEVQLEGQTAFDRHLEKLTSKNQPALPASETADSMIQKFRRGQNALR